MKRTPYLALFLLAATALAPALPAAAAADGPVKAAFLVDAEGYLGAALLTARQLRAGEGLSAEAVEVVVVGKGVKALVADGRLAPAIAKARAAGVRVVACKMALDGLGVKASELAPGVEVVANGFTRILELERDGWLSLQM